MKKKTTNTYPIKILSAVTCKSFNCLHVLQPIVGPTQPFRMVFYHNMTKSLNLGSHEMGVAD